MKRYKIEIICAEDFADKGVEVLEHITETLEKIYGDAEWIGFGELNITYNEKTGKWRKDTEYMSDEFCQAVLAKWLADIERS